jgi:hypothetical protein
VIGFGGGKRFQLGEVVIEPGPGLQEGWSAITATEMDGKGRWLVTATGYADNTGLKWHNPEKNTVGRDWGQAPSRAEGVPARLTFSRPAAQCDAWSLDERGQRRERLPVVETGDKATVEIGPRWRTLWYEVVVRN